MSHFNPMDMVVAEHEDRMKALRTELEALRAERDALKKDCHALAKMDLVNEAIRDRDYFKAERDEWKKKWEDLETHRASCCADMEQERDRYLAALKQSAVRLEILTDRMRACHEETGKHELLDEAQAFADEARAALAGGKETG